MQISIFYLMKPSVKLLLIRAEKLLILIELISLVEKDNGEPVGKNNLYLIDKITSQKEFFCDMSLMPTDWLMEIENIF